MSREFRRSIDGGGGEAHSLSERFDSKSWKGTARALLLTPWRGRRPRLFS